MEQGKKHKSKIQIPTKLYSLFNIGFLIIFYSFFTLSSIGLMKCGYPQEYDVFAGSSYNHKFNFLGNGTNLFLVAQSVDFWEQEKWYGESTRYMTEDYHFNVFYIKNEGNNFTVSETYSIGQDNNRERFPYLELHNNNTLLYFIDRHGLKAFYIDGNSSTYIPELSDNNITRFLSGSIANNLFAYSFSSYESYIRINGNNIELDIEDTPLFFSTIGDTTYMITWKMNILGCDLSRYIISEGKLYFVETIHSLPSEEYNYNLDSKLLNYKDNKENDESIFLFYGSNFRKLNILSKEIINYNITVNDINSWTIDDSDCIHALTNLDSSIIYRKVCNDSLHYETIIDYSNYINDNHIYSSKIFIHNEIHLIITVLSNNGPGFDYIPPSSIVLSQIINGNAESQMISDLNSK
jgi:hypothetical protein